MTDKMNQLAVWWMRCFEALVEGLTTNPANASDATERLSAGMKQLKEAQGLAIQAMKRLEDLEPQLEEIKTKIRRLQGRRATAPQPPAKAGEGASIAVVHGDAGPCSECDTGVGRGPVGWQQGSEPGPLCLACLADSNPDLGALLAVVNQVRRIGRQQAQDQIDEEAAKITLFKLARRYARANANTWTLRPTELLSEAIGMHVRMLERHGPHYFHEVQRQTDTGSEEPN